MFPDGIMVGGLTGSFPFFFVFFLRVATTSNTELKHDLYNLNEDVKADRNGAKRPVRLGGQ